MARAAANSDIYQAIAEPTRRAMLVLLAPGESTVGDIATALKIEQPSVSKHLRVLREIGLVTVRCQGREKFYRTQVNPLRPLRDWTVFFERYWTHQLDRTKQLAEAAAAKQVRTPQPKHKEKK